MKKILDTIRLALNSEEKDFTSGSINQAIILLAIPMVLEMMMESLFAVVDVFFVAQVSIDAVATVGLTESVVTLVYSMAIGLSMAATAMVSRRIGEKDPEAAARAAAQAISLAVFISVILGGIGFFYAETILRWMGGSEELIAAGVNYTRILLGSNIVIMLLFLLNGIFRGAGDANIAMRSLWLANGFNILLDPLFIFGLAFIPEMGVAGAALATTCGRGIGVLYQLHQLFKGNGIIKLEWRHFRTDLSILQRLTRVGAGGAGQYLIASASWVFLMRIISVFGSEVVAGYTIAIRLVIFTILPSWGMANAAATLVGQNLGAGQPDRAATSAWRAAFYNMIFLVAVSIIFYLMAPELILLFSTDPSVVEAGVLCLKVICLGYIFFAYGMVLSQAFNGAGDTFTPTLINLLCFWAVEIPLAYFLAVQSGFGPTGVYIAIASAETLLAIICVIWFRLGRWKLTQI